ncbi:sensor histidine kinase [Cohnella suwonensis]|uniref:Sensor histidine kinase n=1 Tax=Cohnella suwonensis TaxID=696072 RepID=A0ABW0LWA7_9BACL
MTFTPHELALYFQIVVLLSIPQAYIHLRLAFAIWGLQPKNHFPKLFLFGLVNSLLIDLDLLRVPADVHIATSFLLSFAVLYMMFRPYGLKKIAILYFTFTIAIILVEMLGGLMISLFYDVVSQQSMMENHLVRPLSVFWPVGLLLYGLSVYVEKRNFVFFNQLYQYLLDLKQSKMTELLWLTAFQFILLGTMLVPAFEREHVYSDYAFRTLIYLLALMSFAALIYSLRLIVRVRQDAVRRTQDVYVEELGKMLASIRGQRHDFLNHVQVMSSLLKLNKISQLRSYMDDLVSESRAFSDFVPPTSSPALAAFILAKSEQAIAKGIRFSCDIPASVDIDDAIKSVDIVKIIGNLVDNAFDESETLEPERRQVGLAIRSSTGELEIVVSNSGRTLSEQDKIMILRPGYTTKKNGHSGLGLAIVSERVQYYNGTMDIESDELKGISIRVRLPVKYAVATAAT